MLLEHFNEAHPSELTAVLRPCIDIERWAAEIIAVRPFTNLNQLLAAAMNAASPFTSDEIAAAMAHHPRIGERATGSSAEATLSRTEQSAVDPADTAMASALAAGNRAYEAKFDQVFLIRAAGRSPEEILAALNQRINNTAETEALIVAQQLREIAVLRLQGVMRA